MDDCAESGEFCQFYTDFFSLLDSLKDAWWAEKIWQSSDDSEGDWTYNDVTGQWEQQILPPEYLKFKTVEPIISQILGEDDFFASASTSTSLYRKFIEKLQSFDFDSHFSYLNDEDDYGGSGDYSGDYGDYGRKRRQADSEESKETDADDTDATDEDDTDATNTGALTTKTPPASDTTQSTIQSTSTSGSTIVTEHYQDMLHRHLDRFLTVTMRINEFIKTALNDTKREKRSMPSLSAEEKNKCDRLRILPKKISEVKDGNIFSFAKMRVSSFMFEDNVDLIDEMTPSLGKL